MRATTGAKAKSGSFLPFAKIDSADLGGAGPIEREQSTADIIVKRRVGPVQNACGQAMLHRIDMDVIDMPREVVVVPDRVLPEPALPQRALVLAVAGDAHAARLDRVREQPLDAPPTAGEIRVPWRQRHDDMQMIGKNDDGVDRKWPLAAGSAKRAAQRADVLHKCARAPVRQRDR